VIEIIHTWLLESSIKCPKNVCLLNLANKRASREFG